MKLQYQSLSSSKFCPNYNYTRIDNFTKSDELETRLLEIEISDYDGISNARASLEFSICLVLVKAG